MVAKRQTQARQTNQRHKPASTTDGFFSVHYQQAMRSFHDLWRRPIGNILTLAVISIALAMPAALYLLGKNLVLATDNVVAPMQISAYLDESVGELRATVLKDALESRSDVGEVEYISSQQGLADLSQYAGFEQALSLLDEQALPGVLVITPSEATQASMRALSDWIAQQKDITDVRLDEDWLARLEAIKTLALMVASALAILMLGAVFLIVGNTLRFNVLANKDEIQTMKLIGATDHYILRPYLYTGMWFGLLSSIIAWLATALLTVVVSNGVDTLAKLYDSQFRLVGLNWDESLLLVMLGTLIGCIAARLSAKRHLKEIEPV